MYYESDSMLAHEFLGQLTRDEVILLPMSKMQIMLRYMGKSYVGDKRTLTNRLLRVWEHDNTIVTLGGE